MKRFVVFGIAFLLSAGAASGQGEAGLSLTPDEQRNIYQSLTRQPVKTPPPPGSTFNVGASVPTSVRLYNVPRTVRPGLRRYRYTVAQDKVVLVESASRKIIMLIGVGF